MTAESFMTAKLGPVDESTPQEEIREVPDQIAYKLVQVNPEKAKLENIEERLNKWMGAWPVCFFLPNKVFKCWLL
jgi:hypothetical protein